MTSPHRAHLLEECLRCIRVKSWVRAFTGSDHTLADALNLSTRTAAGLVAELKATQAIRLLRRVSYSYEKGRPDTQRTIYVVSPWDRSEGALMLANLIRARGKRVHLTDDQACGRLQCTPEQLRAFRNYAVSEEWITFVEAQTTPGEYERTGQFDLREPPWYRVGDNGRLVEAPPAEWALRPNVDNVEPLERWILCRVPPGPELAIRGRVTIDRLASMAKAETSLAGVPRSTAQIKRLVTAMLKDGRLFRIGNTRDSFLTTTDPTTAPPSLPFDIWAIRTHLRHEYYAAEAVIACMKETAVQRLWERAARVPWAPEAIVVATVARALCEKHRRRLASLRPQAVDSSEEAPVVNRFLLSGPAAEPGQAAERGAPAGPRQACQARAD